MSRKFALLGGSLGHTLSPPIHKRLFDLKGRGFEYGIIEMTDEELSQRAEELRSLDGYNITIPHKKAIISHIDKLDESAARYDSVNCVDVRDGVCIGYNTDCVGFIASIRAMGAALDGKTLLVGCGGVGRMMAIEAALAGADLPLAVKAKEDILKMKDNARVDIVLNTEIDGTQHYDLLMNATPVGMYPKTNACPVPDEVIAAADAVFDVIYNPGMTVLLKKASDMGKKFSNGMSMLVWQAVKAHEIWDGDTYTDEEVNTIINDMQRSIDGENMG